MSRLESFIRRVAAQRDILDQICLDVAEIDGPIMELGLGNGRTYDHLREKLPGRRIVAFDRTIASHGSSTPPAQDIVLGDIRETATAFLGVGAALVHADIGTGYADRDAVTLTWLPELAAGLLRAGGLAVSGLPLSHFALRPLALPPSVPEDRYFIYCRL